MHIWNLISIAIISITRSKPQVNHPLQNIVERFFMENLLWSKGNIGKLPGNITIALFESVKIKVIKHLSKQSTEFSETNVMF